MAFDYELDAETCLLCQQHVFSETHPCHFCSIWSMLTIFNMHICRYALWYLGLKGLVRQWILRLDLKLEFTKPKSLPTRADSRD